MKIFVNVATCGLAWEFHFKTFLTLYCIDHNLVLRAIGVPARDQPHHTRSLLRKDNRYPGDEIA